MNYIERRKAVIKDAKKHGKDYSGRMKGTTTAIALETVSWLIRNPGQTVEVEQQSSFYTAKVNIGRKALNNRISDHADGISARDNLFKTIKKIVFELALDGFTFNTFRKTVRFDL